MGLSNTDNFYRGSYFYIGNIPTSPVPLDSVMFNDHVQIFGYDASTRTLTLATALTYDLNTYGSNLSGSHEYKWAILTNTSDSFQPAMYNSGIGHIAPVCYNIRLHSLILPNVILSSGGGNRIAFKSYIYVQFSPTNNSTPNLLQSNNPNARSKMFKVPITNIVSPDRATFVALSGGGMVHTLRLNPNDSFRFAVYLPNGELFTTLESDNIVPSEPNPDLQVSAVFEFTRDSAC